MIEYITILRKIKAEKMTYNTYFHKREAKRPINGYKIFHPDGTDEWLSQKAFKGMYKLFL